MYACVVYQKTVTVGVQDVIRILMVTMARAAIHSVRQARDRHMVQHSRQETLWAAV